VLDQKTWNMESGYDYEDQKYSVN